MSEKSEYIETTYANWKHFFQDAVNKHRTFTLNSLPGRWKLVSSRMLSDWLLCLVRVTDPPVKITLNLLGVPVVQSVEAHPDVGDSARVVFVPYTAINTVVYRGRSGSDEDWYIVVRQ